MKSVHTSVEIDATPARVWSILADFAMYPEWNPFIQSISGTLRAGERLAVSIEPPGGTRMTFRPVLQLVEPDREIRWQGRLFIPRVFDGEHFFRLQETGGGTLLEHGEHFRGILVAAMGSAWLEKTEQGFVLMNDALKARAEARDFPASQKLAQDEKSP